MAEQPSPVLYLLHGDDEEARSRIVQRLKSRLGDPAVASMNYQRLEGAVPWSALQDAALAAPFLSPRRMVHWINPQWRGRGQQQQFLALVEGLPPTTALVVEFDRSLKENHWLLLWARAHPQRAWVRHTERPQGSGLVQWILKKAREEGGQFTPQAAQALAEQVGNDTTLALQEIRKLLAFVGYRRPVDPEDVLEVAVSVAHPNVFRMVDALGHGNSTVALRELHALLAQSEAPLLWGMVIRQFRLLLLARYAQAQGLPSHALAKTLGVPPFVADKVAAQARRFSLPSLQRIYRHLLDIDRRWKSGESDLPTALDTFFAALSHPSSR